jgi:DNA/RNA-binding domain of Phe-tRNA-synthetase-like protein
MIFEMSDGWKAAFPGAQAGVLVVSGVSNPPAHAGLEAKKEALVAELRARYAGLDRAALLALPVLQAYEEYYKRFKKTYHVQLQLESILFKGKTIPGVAALVEAMFMAEVKNLLLTAGHDLDVLRLPARLEASRGGESYTLMRGTPQELKEGDMFIADGEGILSSVIYGPDQRSQIRETTRQALFTVYAPEGIPADAVAAHLDDIESYIRLFAPQAKVLLREVYAA